MFRDEGRSPLPNISPPCPLISATSVKPPTLNLKNRLPKALEMFLPTEVCQHRVVRRERLSFLELNFVVYWQRGIRVCGIWHLWVRSGLRLGRFERVWLSSFRACDDPKQSKPKKKEWFRDRRNAEEMKNIYLSQPIQIIPKKTK